MIKLENVTFYYDNQDRPAVRDLSLDIAEGAFVGVIGAGGSGKTSLTYLLNGIIPHHHPGEFYGRVLLDGMDTVETSLTDISRVVGSVFEDISGQMVSSTVEDELLFGLVNFGYPRDEVTRRMLGTLADVGISDLLYRDLESLSGGQLQKVAIAATLALSPKVLVLDEPTGELDPLSSERVYELLRDINRTKGTTIIVVEKKLELLCSYVDRVIAIDEGRVALDGPVRRILGDGAALRGLGLKSPAISELYEALSGQGLYAGEPPLTVAEAERMVREAVA